MLYRFPHLFFERSCLFPALFEHFPQKLRQAAGGNPKAFFGCLLGTGALGDPDDGNCTVGNDIAEVVDVRVAAETYLGTGPAIEPADMKAITAWCRCNGRLKR